MAKKSDNRRAAKKAYREAEKAAKRNPKAFWIAIAVVLVIVIAVGVALYVLHRSGKLDEWLGRGDNPSIDAGDNQGGGDSQGGNQSGGDNQGGNQGGGDNTGGGDHQGGDPNTGSGDNTGGTGNNPGTTTEELSIHFLELGNKYSGDCSLLKVGNTEVLIDAGSRQSSAPTLISYIDQYCTDGVLEYVIATHAHQDHIAGFVGNSSGGKYNGVMYRYQIGTLIQFDRTDIEATTDKGNQTLYGKYLDAVEYAKGKGTAVYTGLQCWKETDGAARTYTLAEGITMSILYNPFYEQSSGDENNYSVCTLFTQGDNHYLFTGDLEQKGEEGLVEHNQLPKCKLFKGGHHGSPTSSNECLLSVIQPEVVCVCCCAGSPEYTTNADNVFPSQAFVDRIAKYTDQVYVTTLAIDIDLPGRKWEYASMNGNIVITSNGVSFDITCSNNMTKLKDTEWFQANRTWNGA